MSRYFVGITGASGVMYGLKLVEELSKNVENQIFVAVSPDGITNILLETNLNDFKDVKKIYFSSKNINLLDYKDFAASVSSGSFKVDAYIIIPASMGSIGRIASGISSNLIERCADVALKERRKLVILFREAPLNDIHLENLTKLSRSGAVILPAAPAFYHNPKKIDDLIDFIIGKIFDILNIEHSLFKRWQ